MKKSILAIFLAVIAMAQVHAQDSDYVPPRIFRRQGDIEL